MTIQSMPWSSARPIIGTRFRRLWLAKLASTCTSKNLTVTICSKANVWSKPCESTGVLFSWGRKHAPTNTQPRRSSSFAVVNWAGSLSPSPGKALGKARSGIHRTANLRPESITRCGWGRHPNGPSTRVVFTAVGGGSLTTERGIWATTACTESMSRAGH